jgi:hypothetical protein
LEGIEGDADRKGNTGYCPIGLENPIAVFNQESGIFKGAKKTNDGK